MCSVTLNTSCAARQREIVTQTWEDIDEPEPPDTPPAPPPDPSPPAERRLSTYSLLISFDLPELLPFLTLPLPQPPPLLTPLALLERTVFVVVTVDDDELSPPVDLQTYSCTNMSV